MKTLITTFAIAVMVFAFNPTDAFATAETNKKTEKAFGDFGNGIIESGKWIECNLGGEGKHLKECNENWKNNVLSELEGPESEDREVADSGNDEGSTSAASAGNQ